MPDWQPRPRLAAPPIPDGEITVEPPNDVPRGVPANPIMRLLPVLMIVAMVGMVVLFVGSGAARNPASLLFPAMMAVSAVGMLVHGGRGTTRTAEVDEGRKDYLRYLSRLRGDVTEYAYRQRESLAWRHPEPAALWTLSGTRRMWERGKSDPDFGHVRVGLGRQRAAARLSTPDVGPVDQLEPVGATALRDFVRTHSTVDQLPIALALTRFESVVISGEKATARDVIRAMVCQLVVLHGPELVAVVAVVDDAAAPEWEWLKWLPHHQHPHLADAGGPARLHYCSVAAAANALAGAPGSTFAEHTVVVVDGGDAAGGGTLMACGDVSIITVDPVGHMGETRKCLRLNVSGDELAVVGDVRGVIARPDTMTVPQAELCARRIAPYRRAPVHGTESGGDWAQLLGIGDPASIQPETAWQQRPAHQRLRVAIGATADGSPIELDLKEAAENGMGPHGLCVGATGSGKSEFLRTLVLGLVATHPPDTLNLVLVDFKGGATFLGVDRVRHVAAVITNLTDEAHLVARMKDALAGEMNRRQETLRLAGRFASVADYEHARAAGAPLAPLPTLVVIVDEFSELLSQHPDFAELFVAIGRLGRSLRIHLLLATQRLDEGRLRGLESHLSYRVCLRTFSANESRAVIGVQDAFHLPGTPGAAFLKVGSAEPVAFQTAYVSGRCGAQPMAPRRAVPAARLFTAAPMGSIGAAVRVAAPDEGVAAGKTVLDTVLDRLQGHGAPAHRVWLSPLADSPTLDELLPDDAPRISLKVPVGVVDRPFEQRRDPLLVDLAGSAGNVAIVGSTQSGKSTALRTLVTALAVTHPPDQIQFYCVDFGGGALSALSALPHVGATPGRAEADVVRRTVAELTTLLRVREDAFRRHGIDSIVDYRSRKSVRDPVVSSDPFGDVFLVIDGWASFREDYDALEPAVTALATRGLSYGIHVVLTASRRAEIRPAMKDQIGTRIELRLGDAGDSEVNRKAAQHVPYSQPGRGITCDGMHMLIALPRLDGKHDSDAIPAAISDAAARVCARWGNHRAPRVRLLPPCVDHAELVENATNGATQVVVGVDEDELATVAVDFREQQHVLILGDSECGKTAALRLICTELMRTRSASQAQLMIVDYRRTLLGVVEGEQLAGYAVSGAVLSAQLPTLVDRLWARVPGSDVNQQQLRTRSWWSGPELYLIVDDYELVSTSTGNPLAPIFELLPHGKDLGLHLVVARRAGGAGRAMFEPLLAHLRELSCVGVMMSASPDEGVLLGPSRPVQLPPGRARLVTRTGERVVQLGWVPPCQ